MAVLWNSLLFVLPVVSAGFSFIFVIEKDYVTLLDIPIDGGVKISGSRLFGDNKTWRGFVLMPLISGVVSSTIYVLSVSGLVSTTLPYMNDLFTALLAGAGLGLAYPFGELPNSFFKRQCGIEPGQHASSSKPLLRYLFVTLDIIDSVVVVAVVGLLLGVQASIILMGALLGALLHIFTDFYMFSKGLKSGSFLGL